LRQRSGKSWLWTTDRRMTRKNDCRNLEIRYASCENQTVGRLRRLVWVSKMRGEVIALLDADDVWLPGDLGRVYEEFQRQPAAGMVYHRAHLWNGPTFPTILISFQSRDACGRTGARCCNTQWWAHRADVKR